MKHVDDTKALGRRVREMRTRRDLSQRELAFDGCSYAYLSRIEAGTRQPTDQVLAVLAEKLGTSVRYLKTGVHDPIELGLADAKIELTDLTKEEREMLDHDLEEAAFKTARAVAWAIRKLRTEAARAALDLEHDLADQAAIAAREALA